MKRILYIDDDMRRMRYYAEYLELEGYNVIYFDEVEPALKYIEEGKEKIDLIILDMIMPAKIFSKEDTNNYYETGLLLLKNIRKLLPKTPAIVFSVRSDLESIPGLSTLGVRKLLIKDETSPVRLTEIINDMLNLTI